jgi:hypothetical protein
VGRRSLQDLKPILSMKKFLGLLIFALSLTASNAALPSKAGNLLTLVEIKTQQPLPGFRVQILRISPDALVDPAPSLGSFDGWATFSLTVKAEDHKKEILEAIDIARKSPWEKLKYSGYARWCVRIVGPWNEVYDSIGIDDDNLSVTIDGEWFRVNRETIQALTIDLVRASVKEPVRTKRSQER